MHNVSRTIPLTDATTVTTRPPALVARYSPLPSVEKVTPA